MSHSTRHDFTGMTPHAGHDHHGMTLFLDRYHDELAVLTLVLALIALLAGLLVRDVEWMARLALLGAGLGALSMPLVLR